MGGEWTNTEVRIQRLMSQLTSAEPQGKPTMKFFLSSLVTSYVDYWKRAFALKGRTTRINFWSAFLLDVIISAILFAAMTGLLWDPKLFTESDLQTVARSSWPLFIGKSSM